LSRAKLALFRKMSTEEIVESLRPGSPGALKTRTDGTVLDGHHRLQVLSERRVDVETLPREVLPKDAP
jgi:hypothetical protein